MTLCRRCGVRPLGTHPATSRLTADRDVPICTACGADEADREEAGLAPLPFDQWNAASI
ncbi:hypothetical protein ACN20G_11865 [Streptomyces sp. BI20]|uniref:hypothetical protein n=1 Tax=Streptomyces sp. BI20 TaxID=3403460 RepID=UPI003C777D83